MLTLKAEASPGARIEDSFLQATILASQLQTIIEFDFNTVTCLAMPFGKYQSGIDEYNKEVVSKKEIKVAVARP